LINPVPGEGIEPPTNGLQNRCSTAELTRRTCANVAVAEAFNTFAESGNCARRELEGRMRLASPAVLRGDPLIPLMDAPEGVCKLAGHPGRPIAKSGSRGNA
jgi:hypothetical protein